MRPILIIGLLLVILGIASLFVPVKQRVSHGLDAGPVSFKVTTTERRTVPQAVSAAIIVAGIVLAAVGARSRR